ncbi:MAG: hypothetical protein V8R17_07320 [Blautia obeum]
MREEESWYFSIYFIFDVQRRDIYLLAQGLQGDWPSPIAVSFCILSNKNRVLGQ